MAEWGAAHLVLVAVFQKEVVSKGGFLGPTARQVAFKSQDRTREPELRISLLESSLCAVRFEKETLGVRGLAAGGNWRLSYDLLLLEATMKNRGPEGVADRAMYLNG